MRGFITAVLCIACMLTGCVPVVTYHEIVNPKYLIDLGEQKEAIDTFVGKKFVTFLRENSPFVGEIHQPIPDGSGGLRYIGRRSPPMWAKQHRQEKFQTGMLYRYVSYAHHTIHLFVDADGIFYDWHLTTVFKADPNPHIENQSTKSVGQMGSKK